MSGAIIWERTDVIQFGKKKVDAIPYRENSKPPPKMNSVNEFSKNAACKIKLQKMSTSIP